MRKPNRLLPALALALATQLGCAVDSTDAENPHDATEEALSALKYYDCHGGSVGDTLTHLEVGVSASTVTLTDLSRHAAPSDKGTFDPTYKPTSPAFKDTTRYLGFAKVATELPDTSRVDVMISAELKNSAAKGSLFLRSSGGEGGSTDSYSCFAKAKPVKVSTSVDARLFCSLTPLVCAKGAPPGETCLSEIFVHQSKGSATLQKTWLDHFGVRAQTRKEAVGVSHLVRTSTSMQGSWSENELRVTYRDGVTYLGTLKTPEGKTAKIECSDLAMLD